MTSATLKITLQEDLRRISVPTSISFEVLTAQILKLYGLPSTNELLIKYIDDEGDQVSITSAEELQEAFRICNTFRPPILRIVAKVLGNNAVPLSLPTPISVPAVLPPPVIAQELKEYPPLDVSEWDAPTKEKVQPAVFVTIIAPFSTKSESAPSARSAIAQQTKGDCVRTSGEVNKLAEATRAETVKLSNDQRDETMRISREQANDSLKYSQEIKVLMQEKDTTNDVCSELSKQIMEECKRLSCETARLSSQLACAQRAQAEPSISREVSELCAKTAAMCRELCQATTLLTQ